ncbi:MAG: 50S ribosomal protein L32, partial [Clostridia bacterium]|nr:50S ribosomal protein L32 [Clostridia bacterium]
CGEYHLSHRVCGHCGYYNGKEVIKMEEAQKDA